MKYQIGEKGMALMGFILLWISVRILQDEGVKNDAISERMFPYF